ncbi:type II secretion system protein GspG [Teredinibacter franksiae]|uniref:type II secretion system protein GspG n=1 Tax=Teredinibacter franksiae TaxID=2761453 RepID=UPI001629ECFF|nr:type II secretion system protein GspG [Teredinibacter franksiae]
MFTAKPLFKWLFFIFVGLVLLSFLVINIYSQNEKESYRHHIVTCQLISLSRALNKYHADTGTYPEAPGGRLLWGSVDVEFSDCRGKFERVGEFISDPWGDEIIFEKLSGEQFEVYSENSEFTRLLLSGGSVIGIGENKK